MYGNHKPPEFEHLQLIDKIMVAEKGNLPELKKELENCTPSEQKVIMQMLARTGKKTFIQMCKDAGYSIKPGARASNLKKRIYGKFGKIAAAAGITPLDIGVKFKELLNATKCRYFKITKFNEDGKAIGQEIQVIEEPDMAVRAKAVDMAAKFGGYYAAQKIETRKEISANVVHDIPEERVRALRQNLEIEPEYTVEEADGTVN